MNYRERIAKIVGKNVRIVREYHHYSQGDLAKILEKTEASANANERGVHAFTLSDLDRICREFRTVKPSQLMGYEPLPDKYKK